jgi:hypothetical protein
MTAKSLFLEAKNFMYFKRSSRHFLDSVRKSALGGSGHGSQDM